MSAFSSTISSPPLVDDAHAVGHFLRLLDIMGCQNHGRTSRAQIPDLAPHVLAQFDIDASSRLVKEQQFRLVRECLGDQHAALHPARKIADLLVLLAPQAQRTQDFLDLRGIRRKPEQPARIADRAQHRLEHVGRHLLRDEADAAPRRAPVVREIMAEGVHGAARRSHQPAHRADQRGLACPVGPKQREDFALSDRQIDII